MSIFLGALGVGGIVEIMFWVFEFIVVAYESLFLADKDKTTGDFLRFLDGIIFLRRVVTMI